MAFSHRIDALTDLTSGFTGHWRATTPLNGQILPHEGKTGEKSRDTQAATAKALSPTVRESGMSLPLQQGQRPRGGPLLILAEHDDEAEEEEEEEGDEKGGEGGR